MPVALGEVHLDNFSQIPIKVPLMEEANKHFRPPEIWGRSWKLLLQAQNLFEVLRFILKVHEFCILLHFHSTLVCNALK